MKNVNRGSEHNFFISVVTPVYNGDAFLAECIESVLAQSYSNFEYVIVDNCSTDKSLTIAKHYAEKDQRVRIIQNKEFLNQVKNHNHALRNISHKSIYCKIIAADDRIFPTCLEKMVSLAKNNPKIGVVGAYTLLDWGNRSSVYLTGLPYQQNVFSGKEICRRFLIDGLYVTGAPTTTLIRSEIIRSRDPFYCENSVTEDVDIFFEILQSWDFGFVHDILTYTRRYNESTISSLRKYSLMQLTELVEITKYGKIFLNNNEYLSRRRKIEREYYLMLGKGILRFRQKGFLDFHKRGLHSAGRHLSFGLIILSVIYALLDLLLNPKRTLERLFT